LLLRECRKQHKTGHSFLKLFLFIPLLCYHSADLPEINKGVKTFMPRKPSAKSEEKPQCHIHDKVRSWQIEDIRKNVCVKESDFPLTEHTDGKHYCLAALLALAIRRKFMR
jgi:hypothetical protein